MFVMLRNLAIQDNKVSNKDLNKILYDSFVNGKELNHVQKLAVKELISDFIKNPYDKSEFIGNNTNKLQLTESGYKKMLQLYINTKFSVNEEAGRVQRNNEIIDMMEAAITNKENQHLQFNPQSFDVQKKVGYMAEAYRNSDYSWEALKAMSISELKSIISKGKDLTFFDTQLQFYKQNSAAASLIGIFAVHKIAHAVIENEGYAINLSDLDIKPFTIMGFTFDNMMSLDSRNDISLMSINRTLGSLVAASADAVKDPILNLMNINTATANVLMTMVRLGVPFETAGMFLSQKCIADLLTTFNKENITGYKSLSNIISDRLGEIKKETGIDSNSKLSSEAITEEEVIKGIKENDLATEYKTLRALNNILKIVDIVKIPTFATRYNSITSANGPLVIDNILHTVKRADLYCTLGLYRKTEGNYLPASIEMILNNHPILRSFSKGYDLAKQVLEDSPLNSDNFLSIVASLSEDKALKKIVHNRKLLNMFGDFYMTYLYSKNNVVNPYEAKEILTELPKKILALKNEHKYDNNSLLNAMTIKSDKKGNVYLSINTTGMQTAEKEKLGAGWSDLFKQDKQLALDLFKYSFYRGGIGFNPKSFMNVLPISIKEAIPGYKEAIRLTDNVVQEELIDLFIRNNTDNNSLVPLLKVGVTLHDAESKIYSVNDSDLSKMKGIGYFKVKYKDLNGKETIKVFKPSHVTDKMFICEEISPLGKDKFFVDLTKEGVDVSFETQEKAETSIEETTSPFDDFVEENTDQSETQIVDFIESARETKGKLKDLSDADAINLIKETMAKRNIELTDAQAAEVLKRTKKLC